ncbi:MAG: cupin domain-containing protein [Candidatus Nanopelagicales bacterium]
MAALRGREHRRRGRRGLRGALEPGHIEVEGGPTLEVGPGDVGLYPAGTRTRWTVHETLRKVYVVRP